jgi:diguanylate cyclase (GGDEF)-like protein
MTLLFLWMLLKLLKSQRRLKIVTNTDLLTQVVNRRRLISLAQLAFNQAKSKKHDLSILMIDVDNFKYINESLGHQCGDEVLQKIAQLISSILRKSDVLGRYSNGEFMVCLPKISLSSATDIAQRLSLRIERNDWNFNLYKHNVSVNIGVANFQGGAPKTEKTNDLSELIKSVNEQLYLAKLSGTNEVVAP